MAKMLDALDLALGMRVLEIGAGTGYNAALVTTITGAEPAVGDWRVCAAYAEAVPRAQGTWAVVDSDGDTVFVQRAALHRAGDPALLGEVQRRIQEWEHLGRPQVGDWSCDLTQVSPAETPLLVPVAWTLG